MPFVFCYRLDLLVVVSLFLSVFSFFLSSIICTFVFVSLYYLVCSPNEFILLFFGLCSLFASSFRLLHCLALAMLSLKKIIHLGGSYVDPCPLFFISSPLLPVSFKVDNSSPLPRIGLYLKNIHNICTLRTTAIRHHLKIHLASASLSSTKTCLPC